MKHLFLLLLILPLAATSFCQLPQNPLAASPDKAGSVKQYQGWYFSASLDIKAVPSDISGIAGAALLQVGKKYRGLARIRVSL